MKNLSDSREDDSGSICMEEAVMQMCERQCQASEYRFVNLTDRTTAVRLISEHTLELASDTALSVIVTRSAEQIPQANADAHFKYDQLGACRSDLLAGEELCVSLVCESGMVIGYGFAKRIGHTSFEIEIIDVESASRRSSGLKLDLEIEGQAFSVGIGHVLVLKLMEALHGRLETDATHDSSRYIFKSLGFESYSEDNPCLLSFQANV